MRRTMSIFSTKRTSYQLTWEPLRMTAWVPSLMPAVHGDLSVGSRARWAWWPVRRHESLVRVATWALTWEPAAYGDLRMTWEWDQESAVHGKIYKIYRIYKINKIYKIYTAAESKTVTEPKTANQTYITVYNTKCNMYILCNIYVYIYIYIHVYLFIILSCYIISYPFRHIVQAPCLSQPRWRSSPFLDACAERDHGDAASCEHVGCGSHEGCGTKILAEPNTIAESKSATEPKTANQTYNTIYNTKYNM